VAFSLKTGAMTVLRQYVEKDIWNASCRRPDREPAVCPVAASPDADFGASPALVTTKAGQPLLIAGNKSGRVWALDPAADGKTVWEQQVGQGSTGGGVLWGLAVGEDRVYVPNGHFDAKQPDASGGLTALDLNTGKVLWTTPNPPCGARKPCKPSHAAAVSAMPPRCGDPRQCPAGVRPAVAGPPAARSSCPVAPGVLQRRSQRPGAMRQPLPSRRHWCGAHW
jgi:polyvinyl alcohol dehydrogenase (cytochrome)